MVILSNNDRFYFSWKYDEDHINKQLFETLILYNSFIEIPILPDFASQIQDDIIRKSIHGTAAIEGNPLSEDEVQSILAHENDIIPSKKVDQEIINLKNVYQYLREGNSFCELSVDEIRSFHKTIMDGIDTHPGAFRTSSVRVGDSAHGGTYKPPSRTKDIKALIDTFITFINSEDVCKLNPIIQGILAHYHLALIHPFSDGNGRTARFVEAYIIRAAGYKYIPAALSNYYYRHMDEYYLAFSYAEKNAQRDITSFVEFVLNGVSASLEEIKEMVLNQIRRLTLHYYYVNLRASRTLTERQYFLLMILVDNTILFSFQDLFSKPLLHHIYRSTSERTAQRDLKKLVTLNLLKKYDDGTYEVNLRALG